MAFIRNKKGALMMLIAFIGGNGLGYIIHLKNNMKSLDPFLPALGDAMKWATSNDLPWTLLAGYSYYRFGNPFNFKEIL